MTQKLELSTLQVRHVENETTAHREVLETMRQTSHIPAMANWKEKMGGNQQQDAQNILTGCSSAAAQHLK